MDELVRSESAIQFDNVIKTFAGSSDSHVVLNNVNFSVPRGKTTVIAGGSGQGKSVTLKLILGLMTADSGQVLVDGQDVSQLRGSGLRKLRTKFGVLFQGAALFDSMTVFENVALPLKERLQLGKSDIQIRVTKTLK